MRSDWQVIDAGARYGLHPSLQFLAGRAQVDLVEPDPSEAARLLSQYEHVDGVRVHQVALGTVSGTQEFEITRHPGLSGLAGRSLQRASWTIPTENAEVDHKVTVKVVELSSLIVGVPALVKIDCEGSELDVLRSAESSLKHVSAIRVSTTFQPQWAGEVTFGAIDSHLTSRGFELIGLDYPDNGWRWGKYPTPKSRAQPICGDALWCRSAESRRSDHEILLEALFLYLNDASGLALQRLERVAPSTVRRLSSAGAESVEGLLYAFVLRHLLTAQSVPYFSASDIAEWFARTFGNAFPQSGEVFAILRRAGLGT